MTAFDWRDQLLFDVHSKVDTEGFSIQYVVGQRSEPSWAYTIGFLSYGHPEVIVFGLDPDSAAYALHRLFDEVAQGVFRPVGRAHEQSLGDPERPVRLLPVPDQHWDCSEDRLCVAVEYYRSVSWDRSQLQALQLVWAKPSGHFPWQSGSSMRFRKLQPILDRSLRPR